MVLIQKVIHDRRGNVAITFALVISTLLLVIGCALDYARGVWAQQELQRATDAAVLLVSGQALPIGQATALAQRSLDMNTSFTQPTINSLTLPTSTTVKQTTLITSYRLPTIIMSIFGKPYMDVGAVGQVTRSISKMDVVMVLDNSGSMTTNNRIGELKAAAIKAVEVLMSSNPDARIGLVPFNLFVNVGPKYQTATWINDAAPSQHLVPGLRASTNTLSSVRRFDLFAALGVPWAGCVEARTGGYDVTDDPPTSALTAFVPAFEPDDPGTQATSADTYGNVYGTYNSRGTFVNHYVSDDGDCMIASSTVTDALKQDRTCKYFRNPPNTAYNSSLVPHVMGPNLFCTSQPLTRLSASILELKTAINGMVADGGTNIAEGVGWGLRVLSYKAPFSDGMSTADIAKGGRRYMIVMTDGDNQLLALNNQNGSAYSPYGYKNDIGGRLPGTQNTSVGGNTGLDAMNAKLSTTCKNARTAGVVIYSIGVSVTTTAGRTALTDCASSAGQAYFITENKELTNVFLSIAAQINKPYLSQ